MRRKMKISRTMAVLLWGAVSAIAFDTWIGGQKDYQIYTGLDAGDETSGYWYEFTDDELNGNSAVLWNAPKGSGYHVLDSVDNKCSGICGTAKLEGALKNGAKPFAGVAFDVAGKASQSDTYPATGDASAWKGLCVAYNSDFDMRLELGMDSSAENVYGEKNPYVMLKKGDGVIRNVAWEDFLLPEGAAYADGVEAATKLVSVRFKFQAEENTGCYHFNVFAVGPYEKCSVTDTVKKASLAAMDDLRECGTFAVASVKLAPRVQVALSGRQLSLSGVSFGETLRLMNVRGDVVRTENLSHFENFLDLTSLPSGIYLLQIKGASLNYSRKIVLN